MILKNKENVNKKPGCFQFQVLGNEEITEFLEDLSMSEEEYFKEVKTALTTHGGAENYVYSIENEIFSWKKYVQKNMAVKFGYIDISLVNIISYIKPEKHISIKSKVINVWYVR